MKEHFLKQIKTASRFGLIASIVVVAAAILWIWLSPYTFRQNDQVHAVMMIAVCVLAIANVAMALLTVRNQFPKTRKMDSVEDRLQRYSQLVSRLYYVTFAVILACSLMTVLTGDRNMLMLVLILTLTLFMAFPNMYRMKVDMGLTNEQAHELWGDAYIVGEEATEDAEFSEVTESSENSENTEPSKPADGSQSSEPAAKPSSDDSHK